ncbi:MAG: hypothetical protein KAT58_12320 [candidate division Zixibacteria bacterium]|nr:hypothetical protein [candidate division Zixibacteria bacterium]
MIGITKNTLGWFESLCWQTAFGPDISSDSPTFECKDCDQVILLARLQSALKSINTNISPDVIDEAVWKITLVEQLSLIGNNRRFHWMLTDGVDVEVISEDESCSMSHIEETIV